MAVSRIEKTVARSSNDAVYGNGIDGDVVVTTNTAITSDMYYNNLTVNTGVLLNTNGYRIFVKNTLTNNGFIGIGSVSGGVVGESASAISDGTLKGHSQGVITYRAGGQGGGSLNPNITALPSFLYKDINLMSGGILVSPTANIVSVGGGSKATIGSAGASGAAVLGAAGNLGATGVLGATGSPGATGVLGAAGGLGATGVPGAAGVASFTE